MNEPIFYFFNWGHNGDIHYSREFVKDICNKLNITAGYATNCSPNLIKDIKQIIDATSISINSYANITTNLRVIKNFIVNAHDEVYFEENNKIIFINTWVGSSKAKYVKEYDGCWIQSNYNKFKKIYKDLNISIENHQYYVPDIDWSLYDTNNIDNFFNNSNYSKFYLFCNGPVLSWQAHNINLNPVIYNLAVNNSKAAFILTDKTVKIDLPNVFYTNDITKINGCDLNEIGYLGTKCNFIFGRASGPFCFCHTKQILKDKTKTLMVLCNNKNDGLWAPPDLFTPNESAKQIWSNQYDLSALLKQIQDNLN